MLSFIKANYKTGDAIDITCSDGSVQGQIEHVSSSYIVLRLANGNICGIAAADVRSFTAASPVALMPTQVPATVMPEPEAEAAPEAEQKAEQKAVPQAAENAAPAEAEEKSAEEKPTAKRVEEYKNVELFEVPEKTRLEAPKAIGFINLDAVDRKRHSYFNDKRRDNHTTGSSLSETEQAYERSFATTEFVPAKGQITYYNADRHYGFIHDQKSGNDLYFYVNSVADPALYDQLRRGTRVCYTIGRNKQGFTATCIHLPHTVADLLQMADDNIGDHKLQQAEGLISHVLEVAPNNADAKELLDQLHEATPAPRFAPTEKGGPALQYNPYATYAAAKKAYLEKEYDKAEELYKKAIAAGEKVESCVKDLVTLYVSLYKQAEDEAEKQSFLAKAKDIMATHGQTLPDNLTTKQFLALNYYLPIQDFEAFIKTVDELMEDPSVSGTLSRRVFFMWQKGIALNKMGRSEEALALADEGLALVPRYRQLQNLRNFILDPEPEEQEAEAADAAAEPAASAVAEPAAANTTASAAPAAAAADNAAEPAAPADDTTGEEKSDEWWDELKKPGLI